MFRVLGITLAVLALAIGLVPQFTHCAPHPVSMTNNAMPMSTTTTMAGDMQMSMSTQPPATTDMQMNMASAMTSPKCHGTATAEIGVAVPLFGIGAVLAFTRRRNIALGLSVGGIILGAMAIALPTTVTGTCGMASMICNTTMKPSLYILGSITAAGSIGAMVMSYRLKA